MSFPFHASHRYTTSQATLPSPTITLTFFNNRSSVNKNGRQFCNSCGISLLLRRRAACSGSDITIDQFQTVVAGNRFRLIGKTEFVQCAVKPSAAPDIAGESSPAGSVRSVSRRRKSDDQQPRLRIAERGNRFSPIMFITKPCDFFPRTSSRHRTSRGHREQAVIVRSNPGILSTPRLLSSYRQKVRNKEALFKRNVQLRTNLAEGFPPSAGQASPSEGCHVHP